MTYAPGLLLEMRDYLVHTLGAPQDGIGITGDPAHTGGYHVGMDRLKQGKAWADFSARRPRDVAALKGPTRDAASALDITCKVRDHRAWLVKFLADFRRNVPYTLDVRAINGTLDGRKALRWDREHAFVPTATDDSHLWHTHVEWYRDTIAAGRPQMAILKKFYAPARVLKRKAPGPDVMSINTLAGTDPRGRWTWAQLIGHFYKPPYPAGNALADAAAALRQANAWRPSKADGSATWETVGVRTTVSVPAELDY